MPFRTYLKLFVIVAVAGMLGMGAILPAAATGTIMVDVNDGSCITSPSGDPYNVVYCTIQDAIDDASNGDMVTIASGIYTESLDVNKALSLQGAGVASVTIDASTINDYSVDVTTSTVKLGGFTVLGNPTGSAAYGIKIAGSPPTRLLNITVENVVVDNSRRTGIDLNGIDGAQISNVEVKNVSNGNGLAITDSNDVTFENITTSNNAWGGLAIYTYGRFFSLGSDNVTIQGANSFGEDNKVYVQRGNFNNSANPEPVTNLTINGFDYTVMNDTHRAGGENFTFYQTSRSEAITFALDLATPTDSHVNEIATGDFWVGEGMSIQTAIDHASAGDTINVLAGTFNEQVEIDKNNITLTGAGPGDTLLVSDVTCTNQMNSSATAGVRLLGDHSSITLQDFSVSGYDLGLDIGENIGHTISDVTVEGVIASNNCVHGILSQAGNTDGLNINNVMASNNGDGFFAGRGIWLINGTKAGISITNSKFNNNRLVGIDISDGDVTGAYIVSNTVTGNGDSGIGVLGPQGPNANLIDDNTVTDNGRFGIEIKNPGGTTTVAGNTVSLTGPGSDTRDYAGIAVFRRSPGVTNANQPSGVTIISNTVTGFAEPNGDGEGFGIVVEGTSMSVMQNTVSNNDVGVQVQEGNPSPNTNGTDYFDRGDASVAADVTVNGNNITGNGAGMRAISTTNSIDGTLNWWGDVSGPGGEGLGSGNSVSTNVTFCPWLDAAYPGGASVIPKLLTTCDVDVSLSKTVTPSNPIPGQTITYTLTYSNSGANTANSVRITDTIPTELTNPTVASSSGATITLVGGETFAWTVDGSLVANSGGVITLTAQVSNSLSAGATFTNTAFIAAAGDSIVENNEATADVQVKALPPEGIYLPLIIKNPVSVVIPLEKE